MFERLSENRRRDAALAVACQLRVRQVMTA